MGGGESQVSVKRTYRIAPAGRVVFHPQVGFPLPSTTGVQAPVVDGSGNPTWGWKTTLPAGAIRYVRFTETCDSPPPIQSSPHYHNYSYTDPAGTTHNFDVDFYHFA